MIVIATRESWLRLPLFVMMMFLLLLAYVIKPYTYDLDKYSIYFNTGYIAVQPWHTGDPEQDPDVVQKFRLDERDTTGEPYSQGFEPGFRLLANIGHLFLPKGSLVPRVNDDTGDFQAKIIPRSDATIFLIMLLGFGALYVSARRLYLETSSAQDSLKLYLIVVGPVILGSVFFFMGSQNSLRQFLGLSTVALALASYSSRRYIVCIVLVIVSSVFHRWAPILGLIGVSLAAAQSIEFQSNPRRDVKSYYLSTPEILSVILGISVAVCIKGIAVFGFFNVDGIPLINDFKLYVIESAQHESLERLNSLIKLSAISIVVVGSELLLGKTETSRNIDIRLLRRQMFCFIVPLVIYPEIFSRTLSLYWLIEALFLVWAISSSNFRIRLAGASVFLVYGLAPNAINILIGPGWLHSF